MGDGGDVVEEVLRRGDVGRDLLRFFFLEFEEEKRKVSFFFLRFIRIDLSLPPHPEKKRKL